MPRAYQALHPSEVGELVPASARVKTPLNDHGVVLMVAVNVVPCIILLMVCHSVVKRVLVISGVRVAIEKSEFWTSECLITVTWETSLQFLPHPFQLLEGKCLSFHCYFTEACSFQVIKTLWCHLCCYWSLSQSSKVRSSSLSIANLTSEMTIESASQLTDHHEQNDEWNSANSTPPHGHTNMYTPSRSWYQFTVIKRIDGLVSSGHVGHCQGSNPVPPDYESSALTTTLPCHS